MSRVKIGKYTVDVKYDEYPTSPRMEFDNVSTMYCWSRRYRLGDESTPIEDVAGELLESMEHDSMVEYLSKFFVVTSESETDEFGYVWDCYYIDGDMFVTISETDDVYDDILECLGDLLSFDELVELVKGLVPVFRTLYLYDHSGISISGSSFKGRAPHASWDSGVVGIAIITNEKLKEEGLTVEQGEACIDSEIETYDMYLRGSVFGIEVYEGDECECCGHEELELVDSCYGFYGRDGIAEAMAEGFHWEDVKFEDAVAGIQSAIDAL